jgi:hypothetical protein
MRQHDRMPAGGSVPRELRLFPFRGSEAVRRRFLTPGQLRGVAWRRVFPDVYVAADVGVDHRMRCLAALVYASGRRPGGSSAGAVAVSGLSATARIMAR